MCKFEFAEISSPKWFIIRVPLLPVGNLVLLTKDDRLGNGDANRLFTASDQGRSLRVLLEAIKLHSPSLAHSLNKSELHAGGRMDDSLRYALYSFMARSAFRTVPRSLFCGSSFGRFAHRTECLVLPAEKRPWKASIDLDRLAECAEASTRYGSKHCFHLNPTLHISGGVVHYLEWRRASGSRTQSYTRLLVSAVLAKWIGVFRGERTMDSIKESLIQSGIVPASVNSSVQLLIANQILLPSWDLRITADNPIRMLCREALGSGQSRTAREIRRIQRMLYKFPRRSQDFQAAELTDLLRDSSVFAHSRNTQSVQVTSSATNRMPTLHPRIVVDLRRAVVQLHAVFGDRYIDSLAVFREAFNDRYGHRVVPFLQAVCSDIGVAYSTKQLPFGDSMPGDERRRKVLLHGLERAWSKGLSVLQLSNEAWRQMFAVSRLPLPRSFAAVCEIFAHNARAVDCGDYEIHLKAVVGPTGAELWAHDCSREPNLRRATQRFLRSTLSDRQNTVFADVIYNPEGRAVNIVTRQRLLAYEIICAGLGSAPKPQQILLNELCVGVFDNVVRLFCPRLGQWVIPVCLTAYNHALVQYEPYRMLFRISRQLRADPLVWNWSGLETAQFLPRVCTGNIVLSPATWNLSAEELVHLDKHSSDVLWSQYIESRRLPRWVGLVHEDEVLPCDLHSFFGRELLLKNLRTSGRAALSELRISDHDLFSRNVCGRYRHELLVPFCTDEMDRRGNGIAEQVPVCPATDLSGIAYPPGSNWIYLKIYAAPICITRFLAEDIPRLLRQIRKKVRRLEFFFFRYRDPDSQLRLRFWVERRVDRQRLLNMLETFVARLFSESQVWRSQYDTYYPETERFEGLINYRLAERVFFGDSEVAMATLKRWWHKATPYEVQLLDTADHIVWIWRHFGLSEPEMCLLADRLFLTLSAEEPSFDGVARKLGTAQRQESVLLGVNEGKEKRSLAVAIRKMKLAISKKRREATAADLTHMSINRLFAEEQRLHECRVYFLVRRILTRVLQKCAYSLPVTGRSATPVADNWQPMNGNAVNFPGRITRKS